MALHRIFVAIDIPSADVVKKLAAVRDELVMTGADLKPVEDENLHITLRFIGEVEDEVVRKVCEALREIKFKAFGVRVKGLGAFPTVARPRVIWAGVAEGSRELVSLHLDVERKLRSLGIPPEREEFVPHITLARVKSPRKSRELADAIARYADYDFGFFEASRFVLKESTLTPRGPIYKDVCEVRSIQ